ncbi:MAG: amylo-alpha-1,6-glucosidase, partial [Leptolyngbya sp.]|nr:amylo-alpha-1,6-glucosidase [Leptolyngbya sp.]
WAIAQQREWLITNGIGGYGCGTVAGVLTRHYHGYLVAALQPPLGRTLLFTKLTETVQYPQGAADTVWCLGCDQWADGTITGRGYRHLEQFHLEGTIPVWTYALGDALLEKRLWMEPGANTTYCRYTLVRASAPFTLTVQGFANYRDHHHSTHRPDWQMAIAPTAQGITLQAQAAAPPFYWRCDRAVITPAHTWYRHHWLAIAAYRGIDPTDDHLLVGTATCPLAPGETLTCVVTTEAAADGDGDAALARRRAYETRLLPMACPDGVDRASWQQLHLAADQFIVDRTVAGQPGKTVIAGYPWFGDWGRDTMIALPGLTLTTGRFAVAKGILQTFARYVNQGMVPNLFPEAGERPSYNTVDGTLWYLEAVGAYGAATGDLDLLRDLFPTLVDIVDWHLRGTRYGIRVDSDGLLMAGESGTQLTWMDAKVGDWVVTPRIGKPVEVNALWYNALITLQRVAVQLGDRPQAQRLETLAAHTRQGFQRFWRSPLGYCCDVLDSPTGDDLTLRPNQILAVTLPRQGPPLLSPAQQRSLLETVARHLVTPYGLRSLSPDHPAYRGIYGGSPRQRDGSYHQGTVWGWLMGPFVEAHLRVYADPPAARRYLSPLIQHLHGGCLGTLGEIWDGEAPFRARGAFAQAWTVAAVLSALHSTQGS